MWHDGTSMYHCNQFPVKVSHHMNGRVCGDGQSCGDGGVATGAGGGYYWEHLVTNLHTGGLGVMAVHALTWSNGRVRVLPR